MNEHEWRGSSVDDLAELDAGLGPIREIVSDVKRALGAGAYRSALALTLTIPDICSKAEGIEGDKKYQSYAKWFDENVGMLYQVKWEDECEVPATKKYKYPVFDGMACYRLRNSFLHSWSGDLAGSPIDVFELRIGNTSLKCMYSDTAELLSGVSDDDGSFVRRYVIDLIGFCDAMAKCAIACYFSSNRKSEYNRFRLIIEGEE